MAAPSALSFLDVLQTWTGIGLVLTNLVSVIFNLCQWYGHRRYQAAHAEPLRELAAADANNLETIDAIATTIVDHADRALKAIDHADSDMCKQKFNRILEAGRSIRQIHNKRTPHLNRLCGKQPK